MEKTKEKDTVLRDDVAQALIPASNDFRLNSVADSGRRGAGEREGWNGTVVGFTRGRRRQQRSL